MINKSETCIYGIHPVEELLKNRSSDIEHIYIDINFIADGKLYNILKLCRSLKLSCQCLPPERLTAICGTNKHQGVVAICAIKQSIDLETLMIKLSKSKIAPLLFLPATIQDPGNLGAIIRSCVALGVDGLLLERKNRTPLNATVAKSSSGAIEHITIVRPRNMLLAIESLKKEGFSVIGCEAGSHNKPQELDLTKPTLIITGGEGSGIPPYLRKECTHFTAIPMHNAASSVNVSVAASIILYETARQRAFSFNSEQQ